MQDESHMYGRSSHTLFCSEAVDRVWVLGRSPVQLWWNSRRIPGTLAEPLPTLKKAFAYCHSICWNQLSPNTQSRRELPPWPSRQIVSQEGLHHHHRLDYINGRIRGLSKCQHMAFLTQTLSNKSHLALHTNLLSWGSKSGNMQDFLRALPMAFWWTSFKAWSCAAESVAARTLRTPAITKEGLWCPDGGPRWVQLLLTEVLLRSHDAPHRAGWKCGERSTSCRIPQIVHSIIWRALNAQDALLYHCTRHAFSLGISARQQRCVERPDQFLKRPMTCRLVSGWLRLIKHTLRRPALETMLQQHRVESMLHLRAPLQRAHKAADSSTEEQPEVWRLHTETKSWAEDNDWLTPKDVSKCLGTNQKLAYQQFRHPRQPSLNLTAGLGLGQGEWGRRTGVCLAGGLARSLWAPRTKQQQRPSIQVLWWGAAAHIGFLLWVKLWMESS